MRVREIWSDEACREGKAVCASSLCLCICVPYGGRSESRAGTRALNTQYNYYMRIIGRERLDRPIRLPGMCATLSTV